MKTVQLTSHTRHTTKTRIHDFVHSRNHRQIILYHGLIYIHTYLYKSVITSSALYNESAVPPRGRVDSCAT